MSTFGWPFDELDNGYAAGKHDEDLADEATREAHLDRVADHAPAQPGAWPLTTPRRRDC